MKNLKQIEIADFDYDLPDDRIARYPLARREDSKLLILKENGITESRFHRIGEYLPKNALLVFNDTKVVRARLLFSKAEGAGIELFVLEPYGKILDMQWAFAQHSPVTWSCLVGNSKRWKSGKLAMRLHFHDVMFSLFAERIQRENEYSVVEFSWDNPHVSFAEILELAGEMPLPPYLGRKAENSDLLRYQTVFANYEGSVAAPTAGLHLTTELMDKLRLQDFEFERLTLHVGAGTFKPVSSQTIGNHAMHAERISVSRSTILKLLHQIGKPVIAIGTTSLRTLESLYWIAQIINTDFEIKNPEVDQWFPYQNSSQDPVSTEDALLLLLKYLDFHHVNSLQATTSIMIVPGYQFRLVNGLITNFHQPKSTLLLLVSALIGDNWKNVYRYALDHEFRFLSYGDSCYFSHLSDNQ